MLKAVIDTNLFVSGLISKKGNPAKLLQLWHDHVVLPDAVELDVVKDDPDDNKVLACALAAHADYIVSGDGHLLKLGVFKNIPIVTAKDFLDSAE